MVNESSYYIGLMSGTSMDAVDTALVRIQDNILEVVQYQQFPISNDLQTRIRNINTSSSLQDVTASDVELGHLFADAVLKILAISKVKAVEVKAIGSHGQTVLHLPENKHPRTLQIGDPNIIAHRTGITTVADFRRMDIAAGGEGAPLAPAFHAWQFRKHNCNRVILNIGGMANVTILPADPNAPIIGFDTGPGNALMDDWIQSKLGKDYDQDGQWAASGKCDEQLLNHLLGDPYFTITPPKSTGKDYFNQGWLDQNLIEIANTKSTDDIQATLLELSIHSIIDAIKCYAPNTKELLICGGGVHNKVLVQKLVNALPDCDITSTAKAGLDPDCVEAVTFAWLAKQRLDEIPANLPSVTGANKRTLLGAIYKR